ncbi:SMP-30/gluconolactonase/LRE family protein [Kutzneria sp. NPDC052558]|uniref:SMP-30/gluconolactonase/LRE family protein n=1 Tax=Kutzneria sp. NPDC052558 TaxID=3364121 RepID=UPI0037C9CB45
MFENVRALATGLRFPEGASVGADGSVFVPEIEGRALVRVRPDGRKATVAKFSGGANGCAFGPDGAIYVCDNGGLTFTGDDGVRSPIGLAEGNTGGTLWRVDVETGAVEAAFTECDGERIGGLNDIVFDTNGFCYFVDTTRGRLYYADPVAGAIRVAAGGLHIPNGAGLSPDGSRLYVSETYTGRVRRYDVVGDGELVERPDLYQHDGERDQKWDGLAVDGAGNVCVADLPGSGVRVISPDGEVLGAFVTPVEDPYVTNLCFGGDTAYVSSAGRGIVYEVPWPWGGRRLNFQR